MLRSGPSHIACLAGLLLASVFTQGASKPLLAHYMPWHIAKPYSPTWGWHWTMNHFNPDTIGTDGRREVASHYYPLIGPYDSADPAVLEYHVLLMRLAGIDGVIVDWYGPDDFADYALLDERARALLRFARGAGLSFCLCYEDQSLQHEIDGGFITANEALAQGQATLLYAQGHYFSDAAYFRRNGRPVLLNFGPQFFLNNSDWETLFSALEPTERPALFTLDKRLPIGEGGFNWPPMWLSSGNDGVVSPAHWEAYLDAFEETATGRSAWPAYASTAFPRFDDIYAEAGVRDSYGALEDGDGETLRTTLSRALTNTAAFVQLATWNDFGEGTVLEPTLDYGYRDLGIIQDLRRRHVDTAFGYAIDDLTLARRLYDLRRQHATSAVLNAELDRVFANLVTDAPLTARLQLSGLEEGQPVIYGQTIESDTLRFHIGGYLDSANVRVQQATETRPTAWETVATLEVGEALPTYQTELTSPNEALFFRIRLD